MKNTSIIHKFFTQPLSAETLGLFRIAVGGFAMVQLLVLLPDWMWLYGPKGILPWEVSDALSTSEMPSLTTILRAFAHLNINIKPAQVVYLVTAVYFLSLAGLIAGYK